MLVDVWRILKGLSVILSFKTGSDRRMLRVRIHIILVAKKWVLNFSIRRTRLTGVDEAGLLRQVRQSARLWRRMLKKTANSELRSFFNARKESERAQPRWVDSRVFEATTKPLEKRRS